MTRIGRWPPCTTSRRLIFSSSRLPASANSLLGASMSLPPVIALGPLQVLRNIGILLRKGERMPWFRSRAQGTANYRPPSRRASIRPATVQVRTVSYWSLQSCAAVQWQASRSHHRHLAPETGSEDGLGDHGVNAAHDVQHLRDAAAPVDASQG